MNEKIVKAHFTRRDVDAHPELWLNKEYTFAEKHFNEIFTYGYQKITDMGTYSKYEWIPIKKAKEQMG